MILIQIPDLVMVPCPLTDKAASLQTRSTMQVCLHWPAHVCMLCVCVCMWVSQSCPTFCNPMDYNPPGSSVHGIIQARILEWVAISFSGDLPYPGIEPGSPALQADSLPSEPPGKPYTGLHGI